MRTQLSFERLTAPFGELRQRDDLGAGGASCEISDSELDGELCQSVEVVTTPSASMVSPNANGPKLVPELKRSSAARAILNVVLDGRCRRGNRSTTRCRHEHDLIQTSE